MAARSSRSHRDARRLLALLAAVMLAGCAPTPPTAASAVDPTASVFAESRPPESATPSAIVTAIPAGTAEPATSPDATATPGAAPVGQGANPQRTAAASLYRIEIPRLGINLPVAEGDVPRDIVQEKTPENYAFHLPGTSWFDAGNTYIYAHARVGMFLNLWNARVGDAVTVRTPNGAREYVVAEVHPRVPPTETVWAGPTSDTRLTLQTSTGPNSDDPRFVVVARPR